MQRSEEMHGSRTDDHASSCMREGCASKKKKIVNGKPFYFQGMGSYFCNAVFYKYQCSGIFKIRGRCLCAIIRFLRRRRQLSFSFSSFPSFHSRHLHRRPRPRWACYRPRHLLIRCAHCGRLRRGSCTVSGCEWAR